MNITIIGDGKVGGTLAESLAADSDNAVTIIDRKAGLRTQENLDVRCIKGNGVSAQTLLSAGVAGTDLLIAATSSDERNMVCCLTGKRLGAKRTIARIRDPEYADELAQLKTDLELDMIINPEQAAAGEIAGLLAFPAALGVELFAQGKAQLVRLMVADDMPIANLTLAQVAKRIPGDILIGAVVRTDTTAESEVVTIPNGDFKLLGGDIIYAVGAPSEMFRFCGRIGMNLRKIGSIMIVGGGRIAYYLAKNLEGIDAAVKLIEIDRERCTELSVLLSDTNIICGDGTDDTLLYEENLSEMDGFVSVTGMDEENLMTALLAKQAGVKKVIAKINRTAYASLVSNMGIDNLVSTKSVTANAILRYVRGVKNVMNSDSDADSIETLYSIVDKKAEAIEFAARERHKIIDTPLKKLKLIRNVLIAVIVRRNHVVIPHGNDVIKRGDSVVVFTKGTALTDLDDILSPGTHQ